MFINRQIPETFQNYPYSIAVSGLNSPAPYDPGGDNDTEPIEIIDDLFVPGDEEGEVIFETNDPQYISEYGFTFWYLLEGEEQPFTTREAVVSKISGNSTAGYGLVYCFYDNNEYGETFLVVMINTEGEYIVGEVIGTIFYEIEEWTFTEVLHEGYNQNNELRLEYNSSSGDFNLYINDQSVADFRDDEIPLHDSGRQGYIVVISPQDDFPEIPVKVRFLEQ